jgi:hypothetical protein
MDALFGAGYLTADSRGAFDGGPLSARAATLPRPDPAPVSRRVTRRFDGHLSATRGTAHWLDGEHLRAENDAAEKAALAAAGWRPGDVQARAPFRPRPAEEEWSALRGERPPVPAGELRAAKEARLATATAERAAALADKPGRTRRAET